MSNAWFQEFATESVGVVQGYFIGRVEFEGEVVLPGDLTILLQSGDVEEKMFISESVADSCIIVYMALKFSPRVTLKLKMRLFQSF